MSETSLSIDELLDHASWLRRLARGLARDASEADELVQDTWLAAMKSPPDRRGSPRPWLRRVLQNSLRMRRRSADRRSQREELADDDRPENPTPEEWAHRLDLQRQLAALVLGLGEPQRSTLLLHYYEELPAAEIARRQGVPASTVRWRLQSAISTLRQDLDGEYGDRHTWLRAFAPLLGLDMTAGAGADTAAAAQASTGAGAGPKIAVAILGAAALGLFATTALLSGADARAASDTHEGEADSDRVGLLERAGSAAPQLAAGAAVDTADAERPYWLGDHVLEGQVLDPDGNPIADGQITLVGAGPLLDTRSEADGSFSFAELDEGSYSLRATAPGFAGGPIHHRLTSTSGPAVLWMMEASTLELTLVAEETGEPLADGRAALDGAFKHADDSGRVVFEGVVGGHHVIEVICEGRASITHRWLAPMGPAVDLRREIPLARGTRVSGRVEIPNAPAGWKPVTVLAARDVSTPGVETFDRAVDFDGNFEVVLRPGRYQLEATTHITGALHGTTEVIEVGDEPLSGIEITIQPAAGRLVSGVVLDKNGEPAAHAGVYAQSKLAHVARGGDISILDWTQHTADDQGHFEIPAPAGELVVIAVEAYGGPIRHTERPRSEPQFVTATEEDEALELRLEAPKTGRVAGRVVDQNGNPVAEAQVALDSRSTPWSPQTSMTVPTDAEGRFAFELPLGEVDLWASRAGLDPRSLSQLPRTTVEVGGADVELQLIERCTASGRVSGAPSAGTLDVRVGEMGPLLTAEVDGGQFELHGIPCGVHEVYFPGAAYADRGPHAVDLRPGRAHRLPTIELAAASASGVVVDASGAPIAGARVLFMDEVRGNGARLAAQSAGGSPLVGADVPEVFTDAAGRFTLDGISGGYVVAERASFGRAAAVAVPRSGSVENMTLVLEPFGSVAGTVSGAIDLRARPYVRAVCAADKSAFSVGVGLDGHFQIDRLRPCRYRLTLHGPEGDEITTEAVQVRGAERSKATLDVR